MTKAAKGVLRDLERARSTQQWNKVSPLLLKVDHRGACCSLAFYVFHCSTAPLLHCSTVQFTRICNIVAC